MIKRTYCRSACDLEESTGQLIKDLASLDFDVHRTILVDDDPEHIRRNPENGIGCSSFHGSSGDKELLYLEEFLLQLDDTAADIRPQLSKWGSHRSEIIKQIKTLPAEGEPFSSL
eukprot:gb/GECG01007543.1/.p1 GENE.gb/GECG01007543.1/~~gb/GECG01007543.1/.p1  ORF type:complete len:115 (+),score=10.57 gb/GECG01007543.1/:1-345(+)